MTIDEAIDWLARMKSYTINHTLDMPLWWNEPLVEALEMAIKELEQEPRWIPVSERLPEEEETVLVCYQTQSGVSQSVCEWFDIPNRGIVWSTLCGKKPIAWLPLPKPYKAESEGK